VVPFKGGKESRLPKDERSHSPSDGMKACFVRAPDRRLGAMLGYALPWNPNLFGLN